MKKKDTSIANRIIIHIIVACFSVAIIGTFISLNRDFKEYKNDIGKRIVEIERTLLPPLISAVYFEDNDLIKSGIEGIFNVPNVIYVEVRKPKGSIIFSKGSFKKDNSIEKDIKIIHKEPGVSNNEEYIADLKIVASLHSATEKIKNQIIAFALIQGSQFVIITLLIFYIFRQMVSKRLEAMANYAYSLDLNAISDEAIDLEFKGSNKNDELDKVADSLNKMKKNLKASHEKLRDYAENLEDKVNEAVQDQNKEAKKFAFQQFKQRQTMENMLNNLEQGYLTFNNEGIVDEGATKITEDLLETEILESKKKGKKIWDILIKGEEKRVNFEKWVSKVFEGKFLFKDLQSLAPSQFESTKNKYIQLDFRPIYKKDSETEIETMICIATDKTLEISFEHEAEIEKEKAQMLTSIFNRPLEFMDLMNDANETINHYIDHLRKEKPEEIFRSFHTLKAQFSSFKLSGIAKNIHDLESYLHLVEEDWNDVHIANVWALIDKIKNSHLDFKEKNQRLVDLMQKAVSSNGAGEEINTLMKKIEIFYTDYHNNFVLKEISTLFRQFVYPVEELAKMQDKKIEIKLNKSDIYVDSKQYKSCFSTFLHLFRNAVDHGAESIEERRSNNKKEMALLEISFELTHDKDKFKIIIQDDGKGIDPETIRKMALKRKNLENLNIEKLSDGEVINLIFETGLTSREVISEVSGRGIGLDAVKIEIQRLGGMIKVESEKGKGTKFEITLPLFS